MSVTQNDILDALREVLSAPGPDGEEGFTGPELARASGKNIESIREGLKKLLASGGAEVVRLRRMSIAGACVSVPGYRLKNGKP